MGIELVIVGGILVMGLVMGVNGAKFDELFEPSWALDHVVYDGNVLQLKLDSYSGAGFASKNKYLYGKTSAEIKLVGGDSAGTVTAFYMSSEGAKHNEFDFEFLGNTSGEPYLVQTNLYIEGVGNREQRHDLWFDPTTDFHAYSISWSPKKVVFSIDNTPIRMYRNGGGGGGNNSRKSNNASSVPYPKDQWMGVYSSLWNADDWATQGGRVKTDWSHAPFVAEYREFSIEEVKEEEGTMGGMSYHERNQLIWVRANHLVYDYCFDTARFPTKPVECD